MKTNKKISNIEYIKKIRGDWGKVKPVTRVEKDVKHDKKKRRQNDKKLIKDGY